MDEILSQDEINELLGAISSAPDETPGQTANRRTRIYDFHRPSKITQQIISQYNKFIDVYCGSVSARLHERISAPVSMKRASVDDLTFEEFIRSVADPDLLAVYSLPRQKKDIIIEFDPAIIHTFVEVLCGGSNSSIKFSREMTKLELELVRPLLEIIGNEISTHSSKHFPVVLKNEYTSPKLAKEFRYDELIMLVTIEVKINQTEGMMNLALDHRTAKALLPFIQGDSTHESLSPPFGPQIVHAIGLKIDEAFPVDSTLTLSDIGSVSSNSEFLLPKGIRGQYTYK
jgi:flagellar motor switch protein FliM